MLADKVADGDINFRDALGVMRDLDLFTYRDPSDDTVGPDVRDNIRMNLFNYGNVLTQPYVRGKLENQYLRQIVSGGLRLPQAIEVARQMLNYVEEKDYTKIKGLTDPEAIKREKTESLSKALYALTDLQTDLIADQLVQSKNPRWDEVRSNLARGKEGNKELEQTWTDARKRVVEWSNMENELSGIAGNNQRLRSLLERPVYQSGEGDEATFVSPVDARFKNPAVREQAKV